MIRVGLPASVMGMQANLGQFILMSVVAPFGTLAVAAHSLNQRIENIIFMPSWGLGVAAGVLVGQNLGAKEPARAQKTGWLAAGMVEGFILLCSAAILIWAEVFVRIFSSDPGVVSIGATFLRIATAGYMVMGLAVVLQQCISGSGDTMPPMLVSISTMWLIQLPLAYFLSRFTGLEVYGVRWAIVGGMVAGAIAYTLYFRFGRWKRKVV
jgi:Na+-driven multidrug efflux pump